MARLRVCAEPGCPEVQTARRCPEHSSARNAARDQARGTRQERGYGAAHERLRAQWARKVARGGVHCHAETCLMPSGRLILPGQQWHLDHTDDRTGYRGPSHALCNVSAGGKAAHRH